MPGRIFKKQKQKACKSVLSVVWMDVRIRCCGAFKEMYVKETKDKWSQNRGASVAMRSCVVSSPSEHPSMHGGCYILGEFAWLVW